MDDSDDMAGLLSDLQAARAEMLADQGRLAASSARVRDLGRRVLEAARAEVGGGRAGGRRAGVLTRIDAALIVLSVRPMKPRDVAAATAQLGVNFEPGVLYSPHYRGLTVAGKRGVRRLTPDGVLRVEAVLTNPVARTFLDRVRKVFGGESDGDTATNRG